MRFTGPLLMLSVCAAASAAPVVSMDQEQLPAGSGRPVEIHISYADFPLRAAASVGTLRSSKRHPDVYWWTPPSSHAPQTAVLAFWHDSADQPAEVAVAKVELDGRTDLEIETEPLAEVTVKLAGKGFGPVRARNDGKVTVPVIVPPDTHGAEVLALSGTRTTSRQIPIETPPSRWLAILSPVPMDEAAGGFLWAISPQPLARNGPIAVTLEGGRLRLLTQGPERALYRVQPRRGASSLRVTVTSKDSGDIWAQATAAVIHGERRAPVQPQPLADEAPPRAWTGGILPQVSAQAGFFVAGGANHGPAAMLTVAEPFKLLPIPTFAEVSVGVRTASLTATNPSLGSLTASVTALPVDFDLRARAWQHGPWSLDVLAGGGPVPFWQTLEPAGFSPLSQRGLGGDLFAGAQASYRWPVAELFLDARGAATPAVTPYFDAHLGGFMLTAGLRWLP